MQLNIVITNPAEDSQNLDDYCSARGYADTVNGSPNPETKQQFLKREIIEFLKLQVIAGRNMRTAPTITIS